MKDEIYLYYPPLEEIQESKKKKSRLLARLAFELFFFLKSHVFSTEHDFNLHYTVFYNH